MNYIDCFGVKRPVPAKKRRRRKNGGPSSHGPASRRVLAERDGLECAYCGIGLGLGGPKATIDHIKPLSKGGWDSWPNLCLSCHRCNQTKLDRELSDIEIPHRKRVTAYILASGDRDYRSVAAWCKSRGVPVGWLFCKELLRRSESCEGGGDA